MTPDTLSVHVRWDSQSACSSGSVSHVAVPSVKVSQLQLYLSCTLFVVTNLIVKKSITGVFGDHRHSLDVVLGFLVVLCAYAVVWHVPGIPDQRQSASRQ